MENITYNDGPPPHVGWWMTETLSTREVWRWWDGNEWSVYCAPEQSSSWAAQRAGIKRLPAVVPVRWSHYWPENARVPRLDPSIWNYHEGGGCPTEKPMEIVFRNGSKCDISVPHHMRWSHVGGGHDIVAWRLA